MNECLTELWSVLQAVNFFRCQQPSHSLLASHKAAICVIQNSLHQSKADLSFHPHVETNYKKWVKQQLSLVCCGFRLLATAAQCQQLRLDNNSVTQSAKPHVMFYDVSKKCSASTSLVHYWYNLSVLLMTITRHVGMKLSSHAVWGERLHS